MVVYIRILLGLILPRNSSILSLVHLIAFVELRHFPSKLMLATFVGRYVLDA